MISRREFIKDVAAAGITATAAAAFWNAAPKSVEAYRDYITARMVSGQPLPRRSIPPTAEVYFQPTSLMGFEAGGSYPEMIKAVYYEAGLDSAIEPGDTVALKLHTGERNRESYLRPSNVRCIATEAKKMGADPFVIDTVTAYYPSARYHLPNYVKNAASHGYVAEVVGCPVIPWSDGYWGESGTTILLDGNQLNEVNVSQFLAEADSLVAFTHFKGHPMGIFGGTLKNLGIGGASAYGKFWDHVMRGAPTGRDWTPKTMDVDPFACPGTDNCPALASPWLDGDCTRWCPFGAYEIGPNGMTRWNPNVCVNMRCDDMVGLCQSMLPGAGCTAGFTCTNPAFFAANALLASDVANENCGIRYTDTAVGCWWCYPDGKAVAMNIEKDVQPWCDCVSGDGFPLVPDIGVLGSTDLVAIDVASCDLAKAAPAYPGSMADLLGLGPGDEKFGPVNVGDPYVQTVAGERLGAGTTSYNLNNVTPVWRGMWADDVFYLHDQAKKLHSFRTGSEKKWNDPRAFISK